MVQAGSGAGRKWCRQEVVQAGSGVGRKWCRQEVVQAGSGAGKVWVLQLFEDRMHTYVGVY